MCIRDSIGIGRVERGEIKTGQNMVLCHRDGTQKNVKIVKLYQFEGLKRVESEGAKLGDIVAVSGITDLTSARPPATRTALSRCRSSKLTSRQYP